MGYRYDARYNTILHDGNNSDDFDERGLLKDGRRLSVRMTAMDHDTIDSGDVTLVSRQELADWDKAELSARWRGGLQTGDRLRINGRDFVVAGRNPTNGKIQLRDASTSATDAETVRQEAYDSYDRDVSSRYLTTRDAEAGDTCTTSDGKHGTLRDKNGKLVCVAGGSSKEQEWDIAGPVSDEQRVKIKDEMYASYDEQIQNAWRR